MAEHEVTIKVVLNIHPGEDVMDVLREYIIETGIPEPVSVERLED